MSMELVLLEFLKTNQSNSSLKEILQMEDKNQDFIVDCQEALRKKKGLIFSYEQVKNMTVYELMLHFHHCAIVSLTRKTEGIKNAQAKKTS